MKGEAAPLLLTYRTPLTKMGLPIMYLASILSVQVPFPQLPPDTLFQWTEESQCPYGCHKVTPSLSAPV